ncbi:DNA/RNA nuclease SfsA [Clostridium niameyense]|uniref:Sugar fermentation stimulation protein homolog n=1 Tax=Clostridium niameyense TaxID=1622073 RepID=A0A6M0RCJ0_9CLOT|nr:DNA/RNA nuclease SfsA [Clostridium niameyense]NEZ47986.1 DNA/RNA nuclease SfsA [Clostridium niameyense]
MIINKKIIEAKFLKRPNRFQAYVDINGKIEMIHVPNTGRCKEILIPGCTVILRKEDNPSRKTKYDLIAAYKGNMLINIDSQIPNKVVKEALNNGKIQSLKMFNNIKTEKTFGNSRFDFKLEDMQSNEYYLEVKGVTFEKDKIAKFPDAPTERGTKHLLELIEAKKQNKGAGVLFLIQFDGAKVFSPYDDMDKNFGAALRLAYKNGVDILAYDCLVDKNYIELKDKIEIKL